MIELKKVNISEVKGVGPKSYELLMKLGISNVYDLLTYYPYRYEDYRLDNILNIGENTKVTIKARVLTSATIRRFGYNKTIMNFLVESNNINIRVAFFNQAFLKEKINVGDMIIIGGMYDPIKIQLTGSRIFFGDSYIPFSPIYSLGEMKAMTFKKILENAFVAYHDNLIDELPQELIDKYRLLPLNETIKLAHFPKNENDIKQVMRRVKYEELLKYQLKLLALHKLNINEECGRCKNIDSEKVNEFINNNIGFSLTSDQEKVLKEILDDLASDNQMYRLLQGDVGSGKTVVAAISLYANKIAGFQGVLMAPTEILAEQLAEKLSIFFKGSINIGFLSSSVKTKQRRILLEHLKNGDIDVLIGTHAVISDDVIYNNLGLIIIDEQHRFGVNQRKNLREKGYLPDVLFMTATPIPRTLAISAFGDMDVSVIKEMPAGRKEIKTKLVNTKQHKSVLEFIDKEVSSGNQAYVVTPLIEESEKIDVQNAVNVYERLQSYYNGKFEVGLLHGKLSVEQKGEIMKRYVNKKIHILVSTTVIEVGVDVKDATIMYILDSQRFGLSQLHQLRGRVGRSDKQAYCILSSDLKSEHSQERLAKMTETNDGFKIAEFDLKLRGPGDFFGVRQSGIPKFKMADLINDYNILEVARTDAKEIILKDKLTIDKKYLHLQAYINNEVAKQNVLD